MTRHFTGRSAELAALTELLGKTEAVVICAIAGMAGIGKTTMAVHWAHQVSDRFPDGQLYVNLRGFDARGTAMAPDEALRYLLDAFGALDHVPDNLDALAARYRSRLAGRRVLVVLDNARDAGQVRPLLPGSPGCLVLVTSRQMLGDLVAREGARLLTLDLPTIDEAGQMLADRIGQPRASAEPQAVDEIIIRCGRLPLALAILAARALARPTFALSALTSELREAPGGLAGFDSVEPASDARSVFSWSYLQLSPVAARVFRLIGLHPGPQVGLTLVASLAGLAPAEVRRALAELTSANLITEPAPGRYALHDLLRAYAVELAESDREVERRAALRRMLEHYLYTARCGIVQVDQYANPPPGPPPAPDVVAEEISDAEHAIAWFAAERLTLLTVIRLAADAGLNEPAWRLGGMLLDYLSLMGRWSDMLAIGQIALDAARRLDDHTAQARTHRKLAGAGIRLQRVDDAADHLRRALDLAPDPRELALAHHWMYVLLEGQGDYTAALPHVRRSQELFVHLGDRVGAARASAATGWLHTKLGRHEAALTHCRQALAQMRELGDRFAQAGVLDTIGHAYRHLGRYELAARHYIEAVEQYRAVGDRRNEADSLVNLGELWAACGDLAAARRCWQQALEILVDTGSTDAADVRGRLTGLAGSEA